MNSPNCPHHPSSQMRLVSSAEPLFTNAPGRHRTRRELAKKKAKEDRMIYRCSVEGCPRVEPKPREPEIYMCRVTGCRRRARIDRAGYSDYICRKHDLEKHRERDALKRYQMEKNAKSAQA